MIVHWGSCHTLDVLWRFFQRVFTNSTTYRFYETLDLQHDYSNFVWTFLSFAFQPHQVSYHNSEYYLRHTNRIFSFLNQGLAVVLYKAADNGDLGPHAVERILGVKKNEAQTS